MSVISKASKLLGAFRSIKVNWSDLENLHVLVSRVISAIEETARRMNGLSGEEKKAEAAEMIMSRLNVPFAFRWLARIIVNRVVDRVVAYKNEVYGRFWGTGEPTTGYDEVKDDPLPMADIEASSDLVIPVKVDGVSFDGVLDAVKVHNKEKAGLYLNPFCVVQFSLETGNFKHFRGFNLGGIKATEGWIKTGGKVWNAQTKEAMEGKLVNTNGTFRAYDDVAHFLDDYAGIIYRVYPLAAQNGDCMWLYLAGLCKNKYGSGYATDPEYFSKLCRLAVQNASPILGEGWKEHLARMFELARQRGFPVVGQEKTVLKALGGK